MTALAGLLIGDSDLLLYFSESRTRNQISTKVPIFLNLSLFMPVFYCTVSAESILEYYGNDSQDKTR